MKKTMLVTAFAMLAVLATACGGGGDGGVSIDTTRDRPELLYLGSARGITALAPARGHVRFQETSAVPSRDWSVLYTTTSDGTPGT